MRTSIRGYAGPTVVALGLVVLEVAGGIVRTVGVAVVVLWAFVVAANLRRTARRAADTERRLSESFNASPVPLALVDLVSYRFTEVNDAFVRLVGWSRAELVGHTVDERGILDRDAAAKLWRRIKRSAILRDETIELRRKDDESRHVVLALDLVISDGRPHAAATVDDRTDEKLIELELRAREDQLRQTQKMESLGMLAGGIAHDFNNLLAVIATNASLLSDDTALGTDARELIDGIEETVSRASGLTGQLLAFSRKQVTAPVVLDLNQAVANTRKMLHRTIGDDITLVLTLAPDLHNVRIDPGSLTQLLVNLAVNARDAMPRGGQIEISTRSEGEWVVLSVADTGAGIPPDVLERVFEPFFTTKEVGKGTGMGLAVVHGIVKQAGGRVVVESVVGAGTTFTIHVPRSEGPAVEPKRTRRITISQGTETLLVVDDDESVRRSASRALQARGYTVVEASSGAEALRALSARPFDLLLTDVVMPRMDGSELARAATSAHPALKILYMSGCVDDVVVRHGVERAEVELIEKPFSPNSLASKVRQVLRASRGPTSRPQHAAADDSTRACAAG